VTQGGGSGTGNYGIAKEDPVVRGRYRRALQSDKDRRLRSSSPATSRSSQMFQESSAFVFPDALEHMRTQLRHAVATCNVAEAMQAFEILIKEAYGSIHVISCNKLINMLSAAERVDLAIVVYEAMKSHGIRPTVVTYSTLLTGIARNTKGKPERKADRGAGVTTGARTVRKPPTNRTNGNGHVETDFASPAAAVAAAAVAQVSVGGVFTSPTVEFGEDSVFRKRVNADNLQNLGQYFDTNSPEVVSSKFAWRLFEEMIREQRLMPDLIVMNSLISACARGGDLNLGLKALSMMEKLRILPNVRTFNSLLSTLTHPDFVGWHTGATKGIHVSESPNSESPISQAIGSNKKLRKLWGASRKSGHGKTNAGTQGLDEHVLDSHVNKIMSTMEAQKIEPSIVTFSTLVDIYGRRGNIEKATMYFEMIEKQGLVPNEITYSTLIHALGRKGLLNAAFSVLDKLKQQLKTPPNVHTYTSLIDACGKANKLEKMFEVFALMMEEGVEPNVQTYTSLIDACGKAGDVELALNLFHAMQRANIAPNEVTYTSLLQACTKRKHLDDAFIMFTEASRNLGSSMPKNASLYNELVLAFGKGDEVERAFSVFECMKKIGIEPDSLTLDALLEGAGRANAFEQAIGIFEEMKARGIVPHEDSFRMLVAACGVRGELVSAFMVFSEMKRAGLPLSVAYNSLLEASLQANDIEAALCVFEDMRSAGIEPSSDSYRGLLNAATSDVERFEKARAVLNDCVDEYSESDSSGSESWKGSFTSTSSERVVDGSSQQVVPVSSIPSRRMAKEALVQIFLLFMEMENSGIHADTIAFNCLMDACALAGDSDRALQVLGTMRGKGVKPDTVTYTTFMKACLYDGELKRAFNVLEAMRADGVKPSTTSFSTMIDGCMKLGRLDLAMELYDQMLNVDSIVPDENVFKNLINGCIINQELNKALTVIKWMNEYDISPRSHAVKKLSSLAKSQGKMELAAKLLKIAQALENNENAEDENDTRIPA